MDGEKILRTFLKERFGNYRDTLAAEDPLDGVVDSLGLFELVEFIEREFQISVPTEEFSPRRFSSISVILNTIEELRV
jgi:acyl carrier protein